MARIPQPGISYYPLDVDHIRHNKIRLLFNEFGSDGYWIWQCLLARIYEYRGYYMDVSDKDELELFAIDVCKKQVALVSEVISGCVRRGLFDSAVFNVFKVLTSDRIQLNYLEATLARRKKTSVIELKEDYLLIKPTDEWRNVIITAKTLITPATKAITPGSNSQSRVEGEEELEKKLLPGKPAEPKLYTSFTKAYVDFYSQRTGIDPKINGAEGKHIKQLIDYFKKAVKKRQPKATPQEVDDQVLVYFKYILDSWDNLSDFLQPMTDIKSINSQLNRIIAELKATPKNV